MVGRQHGFVMAATALLRRDSWLSREAMGRRLDDLVETDTEGVVIGRWLAVSAVSQKRVQEAAAL